MKLNPDVRAAEIERAIDAFRASESNRLFGEGKVQESLDIAGSIQSGHAKQQAISHIAKGLFDQGKVGEAVNIAKLVPAPQGKMVPGQEHLSAHLEARGYTLKYMTDQLAERGDIQQAKEILRHIEDAGVNRAANAVINSLDFP
jgi:hypothetical protein